MRAILLLGIILLGPAAHAETMHLVCIGAGSANKTAQRTVYSHNSRSGSSWATATGQRSEDFVDQIYVDIDGATGRIQMPPVMLPPIHGGNDGWMDIEKLSVSDREITGSVGVNFMNSPKLRIDRVSGILSLAGKAGNYAAQCSAYDPDKVKKAF
jgi:hypothetical protein